MLEVMRSGGMYARPRRSNFRAAAIAAGYVVGLGAIAVGTTALTTETNADDAALWLFLIGTGAVSFAAGYAVCRWWILGVPAAISAVLMTLVLLLLSSGFPSYDDVSHLSPDAGYALGLPFVALLSLGVPMALGVAVGQRAGGKDDRP
jgi:peptidoglycan/LPS O-acetylase OafA/YrhL